MEHLVKFNRPSAAFRNLKVKVSLPRPRSRHVQAGCPRPLAFDTAAANSGDAIDPIGAWNTGDAMSSAVSQAGPFPSPQSNYFIRQSVTRANSKYLIRWLRISTTVDNISGAEAILVSAFRIKLPPDSGRYLDL
jgi:hypothetical protein